MSKIIFLFPLILANIVFAGLPTPPKVVFESFPLERQLYQRDINTNMGNIDISGLVILEDPLGEYDSLRVLLYKDNVYQSEQSQKLVYTGVNGDSASFDFDVAINAELSNYKVELYAIMNGVSEFLISSDSIVSGDTYIVHGQSNAQATMYDGSSSAYDDPFVRTYVSGASSPSYLLNNNEWYVGIGDQHYLYGSVGQWGLVLGKKIVDSIQVPVAIFNGAHGGQPIEFFQRPSDYEIAYDSNYSRLYYRLNRTNLKNSVRAVIWSQGETDAGILSVSEYKNYFTSLKNDLKSDYPSIERFYVFQTKHACSRDASEIMEAQRQLAVENTDITVIPTSSFTHHTDLCHYPFVGGYEEFGKRVFDLIHKDIYGKAFTYEVDAPMITGATYTNSDSIVVVSTTSSSLTINNFVDNFAIVSSISARVGKTFTNSSNIESITTSGGDVIIKLNAPLSSSSGTISYTGPSIGANNENLIVNNNGIELIPFYEYDLNVVTNSEINFDPNDIGIYPIPANDILYLELDNEVLGSELSLLDNLGKTIQSFEIQDEKFNITLPEEPGVYIVRIQNSKSSYVRRVLKK